MNKYTALSMVFVLLCLCTSIRSETQISPYDKLYNQTGGQIKVYYDYVKDGKLIGGTFTESLPYPGVVLKADITLTEEQQGWEVTTVIDNGPTDNRVDWVIMGDGYTIDELPLYAVHVQNIVDGWFQRDPFDVYANYFNVHRVDAISNDSGIDDYNADPPVIKDTALDMYREGHMVLLRDRPAAEEAAASAAACDIALAIANTTWYGGSGALGLATAAADNQYTLGLVLHEMGHSFGRLADEYYSEGTYTGPEPDLPNVSIYNASELLALKTKWYRWLDLPHIDTFEGGYYNRYGIYRPTEQSTMNWLENPFYEVNAEQLIFRIYEDVSPVDDATEVDNIKPQGTSFYVTPMQPVGHNLDIQWAIDDINIPAATEKTFIPDYNLLDPGIYRLSVTVTDNTPKVRDEQKRAKLMTETRVWKFGVLSPSGIINIEQDYCSLFDVLHIYLIDEHLIGMGAYSVSLATIGGDNETLLLIENSVNSGIYEGIIETVHGPASANDGVLNVSLGDKITAIYQDQNDGTGQSVTLYDYTLVSSADIKDNFDKPHDYLANGVEGTIWDGMVGLGINETADVMDAGITSNGVLRLASRGSYWGTTNDIPYGPFLYINIEGNFVAKVKVSDYIGLDTRTQVNHNDCGLIARIPNLSDAGYGEDWIAVDFFPIWNCGNMWRQCDNNVRTEHGINSLAWNAHRYLQLERQGNTFHMRTSEDGVNWVELAESPEVRDDFDGLPVQLGLKHAIWSSNFGYVEFDNFSVGLPVQLPGKRGFLDFAVLAAHWLESDCGDCGGADLNGDHQVNATDLVLMSNNWLGKNDAN